VNGKNVERLQGGGVVAADHVLVPNEVGQVGGKRSLHAGVGDFGYLPATQLQAEQLPRIKHFPVVAVTPPVQPVALVARGYFVFGTNSGAMAAIRFSAVAYFSKSSLSGALKKRPLWRGRHARSVLKCKQSVLWRARFGPGIRVVASARGQRHEFCLAGVKAVSEAAQCGHWVGPWELAASVNCPHRQQTKTFRGWRWFFATSSPGRRSRLQPHSLQGRHFTHRKYLTEASRAEQKLHLVLYRSPISLSKALPQCRGCAPIGLQVEVLHLFLDNPVRHRVDVAATTPQPQRFASITGVPPP